MVPPCLNLFAASLVALWIHGPVLHSYIAFPFCVQYNKGSVFCLMGTGTKVGKNIRAFLPDPFRNTQKQCHTDPVIQIVSGRAGQDQRQTKR